MKKLITAILFILHISSISGQIPKTNNFPHYRKFASNYLTNIDSLHRALAASKEDIYRVIIIQEIAFNYAFRQLDSTLIYANEGIELSKKLKYPIGEALCLMRLAVYYRMSGASAQGMQYALKAVPIFAKQNDIDNIILCNLLVGWTLEDQEYPKLSVEYVLKVTPLAIQYKSEALHWCYSTLCVNYNKLNILDSALIFGLKTETLVPNDILNLTTIGDIYLKMHNISEARKYYSIALNVINNSDLKAESRTVCSRLSNFYYQTGQLDSAIYFAKKVMNVTINKRSSIVLRSQATLLADIYRKKGIKDSMIVYMQLALDTKDTMAGQEKINLISLLYNEQLHQQELESRQLQYEKQSQIFFLLITLVALLLIAIVLFRHDRQKQKANAVLEKTLSTLKSTQNQLIQKEKLASLGELTAGIAHEIQNPLNFVNNFSELSVDLANELEDEIKKPELDKELIEDLTKDIKSNQEKINHHGKRASSIVKGMLEHSRTSTGERALTDINALADEYLRLSYHGMRAKDKSFNADYKTDFDENLSKIEVIPQDIGRVLLNLINNAFYAVQERNLRGFQNLEGLNTYTPSVIVSTQRADNQIILSVKDNGNGMPENIKAKIFQPFFTTKPTGQGTGLGLSLAYDIVTKGHGGTLEVETTEGVGSEFIIHLPIKTKEIK